MHLILGIMRVKTFKGGYDDNFCYVAWCKETLEGVIVDPSVDPNDIFQYIKDNNIKLLKIFITHTHYDHISYLSDFINNYPDIMVYSYINTRESLGYNFKGVQHNDRIKIGSSIFTILYTPGHYVDCLCYWNKKNNILFTGDTVFVGRTGRTINKHSNISKLYHSVYDIILKLPMDTEIYPGHDYGPSNTITIYNNIKSSSFFSCNSEKEFISVMKDFELNR